MRVIKQLSGFLLLLCMYLCSSCTDDADYTWGVWNRMSDFDGLARGQACSFTIGNKGYICCGYNGKVMMKDLWVYDIDGNYWTQLSSMPDNAPLRYDATAFAVDGKGYVTTGYNRDMISYLADTWEYNPNTDIWTQKDDFAGGARSGAIAFSIGSYGYVGTGYNDNTLKDFYRFNPNASAGSQWEIVNRYGGQKRQHASVFVINDVAYVCCGLNNSAIPSDFWKFDGTTWTRLMDIVDDGDKTTYDDDRNDDYAIARVQAVTFVIDGKGYIATGGSTLGSASKTDYWKYDPSTDIWYGDSDDDYTAFEGTARYSAVSFSTGKRGFIVTGRSSSYYYEDMWELLPDVKQDVD